LVGNIMIDSLLKYLPSAAKSRIKTTLGIENTPYAVATLHRPANVDNPTVLAHILKALAEIGERMPVVFPVHPRTQKVIDGLETIDTGNRLIMTKPLGYLDFLSLYSGARLVLTDSGGIQEETTVLGVPCLTLRENTERPVTVELGTNLVVGSDPIKIKAAVTNVLDDSLKKASRVPPLWDGKTAERILNELTK
jgi:UDP-N-acetylglucosamine 2-epimerase (non-hydrolysing)